MLNYSNYVIMLMFLDFMGGFIWGCVLVIFYYTSKAQKEQKLKYMSKLTDMEYRAYNEYQMRR